MTSMPPATVLVAPDSFKGSLTSVAVATALADGWRRARPGDDIRLIPLADGGEGTLDAIAASGGWRAARARARSARQADRRPLPAPRRARRRGAGDASGLSRVAPDERDARRASTFGTGLVLAAAIGLGVRDIVLGVGGSDDRRRRRAPAGARRAVPRCRPAATCRAAAARWPSWPASTRRALAGPRRGRPHDRLGRDQSTARREGAAATYGPRRGPPTTSHARRRPGPLTPTSSRPPPARRSATGRVPARPAARPPACSPSPIEFRSFEVRPGVEVVMELTGFDAALAAADIVLTGEGRIDRQTAFGKTALGVARRAHQAGVPASLSAAASCRRGARRCSTGASRCRSSSAPCRSRPPRGRRGAGRARRRTRGAAPVVAVAAGEVDEAAVD